MVLSKRMGSVLGRVLVPAVLASTALMAVTNGAEARKRYRGGGYSPPYASIVVDAKTGKTLQATNPDAARHPASVTKVMTLYMLFEQLERGRFNLESEFRMTSHCAAMAPSKLGLRAGETIAVEDAIKAVVTKSANDVACAIGANIAGDEETFAEQMTAKAHAIGMKGSNFENASGLPNPRQITTARDLALLGRVIQERFPKYYGFFGTRSFHYDGYAYRNHNRLLGRVEGVDGIKTGYTRASGFNLLTSAKLDGRHVITVVLGGKSGRQRDAQVTALVENHLPRAFAGARQIARTVDVASNDDDGGNVVRQRMPSASAPMPVPATLPPQRPKTAVVTELPPQRPAQLAAAAPNPRVGQPMAIAPKAGVQPLRPGSAPLALAAATTPSGPGMRWTVGAQPAQQKAQGRLVPPGNVTYTNSISATPDTKAAEAELDKPAPVYSGFGASMKQAQLETKPAPKASTKVATTPSAEAVKSRSGWVIQIAATDDETKARGLLAKAKSANPKLASADAFTEKVNKGETTLYRARFGGLENGEAQAACQSLKKSGFACIAQRI